MLCLSVVGRQSSGGKGQRAASIVEADIQESAPEMSLRSLKLRCKYLQSAENQNRGLVAEPKPYPAWDRQQEVPAP